MALYLGRIVAVACTPEGRPAALYRVSSRSFPNRRALTTRDGRGVAIVPKPGHEGDVLRNPYIAYNCARLVDDSWAVVSNGSHTDPVAEKLEAGYPPRDALAASLLGMDYEKDDYNTPRIAAVVPNTARMGDHLVGWLGTVRADGLEVRCFKLAPGECVHLSTYEHALVGEEHRQKGFDAKTAADACAWALGKRGPFAEFSNPVTAVCAVLEGKAFALAAYDSE